MNSRFIVSAWYDRIFFIYQPLIALGLGALLSFTPLSRKDWTLNGQAESVVTLLSGVVTMSHLVIVFFRSHANAEVFRRYPFRFIWAPLILFAALSASSWVMVVVFVTSIWWDVYHSSLQTFGLARAYDQRAGNDPVVGRQWDRALNLFLYLGPVLAGVSLADHILHFNRFQDVGAEFFSYIPAYALTYHRYLTWAVVGTGLPFLAVYLWRYRELEKRGYRVPREKTALLASTGLCSIVTWGFNPFGEAFFIMNLFHAVQYFALIWHKERSSIRRVFGPGPGLTLFWVAAIGYGVWAEFWGQSGHYGFSLLLTVSILHFWYDGFVWSVRKREV